MESKLERLRGWRRARSPLPMAILLATGALAGCGRTDALDQVAETRPPIGAQAAAVIAAAEPADSCNALWADAAANVAPPDVVGTFEYFVATGQRVRLEEDGTLRDQLRFEHGTGTPIIARTGRYTLRGDTLLARYDAYEFEPDATDAELAAWFANPRGGEWTLEAAADALDGSLFRRIGDRLLLVHPRHQETFCFQVLGSAHVPQWEDGASDYLMKRLQEPEAEVAWAIAVPEATVRELERMLALWDQGWREGSAAILDRLLLRGAPRTLMPSAGAPVGWTVVSARPMDERPELLQQFPHWRATDLDVVALADRGGFRPLPTYFTVRLVEGEWRIVDYSS
jgi:hypothetical protein